jgi:hypothetical protein
VDPADFLIVARNFYNSGSEAERRTAISRSYYALFNMLREKLLSVGVKLDRTADDHQLIAYYLTNCRPASPATGVGVALNSLRTDRNIADYDMSVSIDAKKAEYAKKAEFAYRKAADNFQKFDSLDMKALNNLAQCITALVPPRRLINRP